MEVITQKKRHFSLLCRPRHSPVPSRAGGEVAAAEPQHLGREAASSLLPGWPGTLCASRAGAGDDQQRPSPQPTTRRAHRDAGCAAPAGRNRAPRAWMRTPPSPPCRRGRGARRSPDCRGRGETLGPRALSLALLLLWSRNPLNVHSNHPV